MATILSRPQRVNDRYDAAVTMIITKERTTSIWRSHFYFLESPLQYKPLVLRTSAGLILGLRLTNERRRYKVTPSPTDWAQAQA